MDNQTLEELAAFSELLDFNKIFMLVAAATFLWLANDLLRRFSQKLMEKIPSRRFLILQTSTLIGFSYSPIF